MPSYQESGYHTPSIKEHQLNTNQLRHQLGMNQMASLHAFYSRVTYGLNGPITSTVRGVEIKLSPKSICRIFNIPSVGLRVYESKVWLIMPSFEPREAIQRMCGLVDAQGMGKPLAHSLTVSSRVLHHIICSILLP